MNPAASPTAECAAMPSVYIGYYSIGGGTRVRTSGETSNVQEAPTTNRPKSGSTNFLSLRPQRGKRGVADEGGAGETKSCLNQALFVTIKNGIMPRL